MIELSGREIVGASKITDRQATEFKRIVDAVEACGDQKVRLNLTDLDATTLWKREKDYYALISKPNLTVIVDPETAATIRSYALLTGTKINFEVRELEVVPEEEDPRIEERGRKYATLAKSVERYTNPITGKTLKNCLVLSVADFGIDTLSSIGISGLSVGRAFEIAAKQAHANQQKLVVDFTDIGFEGGCDIVLADTLVQCKSKNKGLVVKVFGEESGIDEYVSVNGRVKLSATSKVRFFNMLRPNTVFRLNSYPSSARSDIAGRKGGGKVIGAVIVIYKGLEGEDALYYEIPTEQLFLPEDLPLLGEQPPMGDKFIPRRRNIAELGILGVCSGSHGHFGPVSREQKYGVNDGHGNIIEIDEIEFVARGLRNLGVEFDAELLSLGRILPPPERR